jgi:hypothetical protein
MAFNRDLSQLANFLEVNSDGTFVNIIPSTSEAQLGIGTNNPTAKLDVLGNARVSGNLSAGNINASGIVTATSGFVGALTGLASSATQLETGRTIAITGDLTYTSGSFDGTGNVTGTGTLANTEVTPGSYGSSTEVATFTVDSKGRLTAAGTASVGTALTVAGDSGSENISLLSEVLTISGGTNLNSSAASNTVTVNLDPNISLTSVVASGIITATSGFVGNVTGTATSTTNIPNLTGDITSNNLTTTLATVNSNVGSFGSQTLIPVVTVNAKGLVTSVTTAAVGTALTVSGDSGSENIDLLTETLTISGGTNLTSSAASNAVTVNLDNNISLTSVVASGIVTAAQFVTGASGSAIGISTNTISGPATITIDPSAVGDNTGLVVIKGDLQIDGTTTTINSTTVTIDDKNIQIADGAANDVAADGAGFTIVSGDGNKTFQFQDTGDNLGSSENLNIASGKVYKVNNTEVLSSTTLGSGVVNSSLTSVGTLTNLSVGNVNSSGIVTATTFVGALTGNVTGDLTGEVNSPSFDTNASGVVITGVTTSSSGFVGDLTGNVTGNLSGNINSSGVSTVTSLNATNINSSGIVTATSGFVGALTGNVTGNLSGNINSSGVSTVTSLIATNINASGIVTATSGFVGNLTGEVNAAAFDTNASGVVITGVTTSSSGFVGNLTGLASSATQLQTGRTVAITGDLAYTSGSFDGTGDVTGTGTLATVNSNVGSFGSQTLIPVVTVNAKGLVTSVTTAAVGTALTVTGDSGSENIDLLTESLTISGGTNLTSSAASNSVTVNLDPNISLTSVVASGIITATSGFVGNITGNLTGDINSSGVSTVTSLNATSINASGIVTAAQFVTGASGSAIGINTNTISGPATITIDPAGVGDNTGAVRIKGDLFVDGTQFIVNSTTIELADFIVGIASTATTDILADGAGIKIGPDNTLTYDHTNTALKSSENFNVASGKTYKIDGTDVLSSTTLGSGVINSSLTSVGTLTNLSVGNVNSTGIITATSGFVGNLTGNINSSGVSTVTNLTIGGYVSIGNTIGIANQIIASTGVGVTWKTFNDLLPQTRTTQTFTATAGQTLFSFVYNVNFLDVFVNGVKLSSGEFTASNGSTITLSEGAFVNDTVEFVSYATLGAGTGQVSSLNDLTDVTLSGIATGNLLAYNGSEFVNTSNINVTGIITATSFVGDGSGLTGAGSTVADDVSTNGTFYPVLTQTTTGTITSSKVSTTKLSFNPSTGTLSATSFAGALTGNVTGNVNASGIVTAAQFVTGASGSAIGINTNTISGPATITIDPAAVGDNTGLVVIKGDLQIDGTTTTVNSTTMTVDDINITLASGAANAAAANGAGITIDGASATLLYASTGDKWVFNKDVEAVDFNSTSDINLKENIRQVESASELVSKLEGVHFSWKETGKETIGVIAQQIEEHLPQLVQTGDTHKTVNYNGLIGVLIEAVKEQGAQIAALQAEIEELKK